MTKKTSRKESKIIYSVAEETKKLSYLGAAGPYLVLGEQSKAVIDGSTLLAVAMVWFIICQVIAHALMALAEKMEA